ncbi:hypothetical protein EV356DRAFT_244114 [Viridothelium virens]|uniref:Uncharacterized protein n=1 Tax=Viridothelium virens TaxID=1048519 RepID=A0A6A6H5E3_VIRVR|nr:hypothetical protein EV356DRAFT_244114 [Viridothelium virens]
MLYHPLRNVSLKYISEHGVRLTSRGVLAGHGLFSYMRRHLKDHVSDKPLSSSDTQSCQLCKASSKLSLRISTMAFSLGKTFGTFQSFSTNEKVRVQIISRVCTTSDIEALRLLPWSSLSRSNLQLPERALQRRFHFRHSDLSSFQIHESGNSTLKSMRK